MAIGHAELRVLNKVMDAHFEKQKSLFTKEEVLFIVGELQSPEKYIVNLNVKASRFRVFKYFVQYCLYRNLANFDSLILISGDKGQGKSSFAIMLAKEWCRLLGIRFDSDKHIAYSNRQVQEKIDKLERFQPLICDEAINFATSESWGKCLSGDTIIKTPNGNFEIKTLVGKGNFDVYTYNQKNKQLEIQNAERCIKTKNDYVYEIELSNSKKIKCTKEHQFLTTNGWKQLQELKEGDEVIGI